MIKTRRRPFKTTLHEQVHEQLARAMLALGGFATLDTCRCSDTFTTTMPNSCLLMVAAVSQVGLVRGAVLNR
jgi:hypothetical protein